MSIAVAAGVTTDSAFIRVRLQTQPNASAEELHRIIGAALDEVALAYILLSSNVLRLPPRWRDRDDDTYFFKAGAQLNSNGGYVRVSPPYHLLARVRSDVLTIRHISYSNPLDIVIGVLVGAAGLVAAMAQFINTINLMASQRKLVDRQADEGEANTWKLQAEAAHIELQSQSLINRDALETQMMEVSLEEKRFLLKKAEVDLRLAEQQVNDALERTEASIAGLANDATEARGKMGAGVLYAGPPSQWPDRYISEVVDNNRLAGSVDIMGELMPEVELIPDDGI